MEQSPIMRKHTALNVLAACWVAAATVAVAQSDPTDLKKMREVYLDQLQKAQEQLLRDLGAAPEAHVRAMQDLETQIQKAGDLIPLLAVRKERERFAANPELGAMALLETPKQLRALQDQYIQKCKDIRLTHAHMVVDLSQKYVRSLGALQKELTQKGKIEDALKVMNEADAIKTSDPVKAAQALITAGGTEVAGQATTTPTLDTSSVEQIVHGEVASWNSVTGEITCKYDFAKKEQFVDWEGGSIDDLRERLVCDNVVVWLMPNFKAVNRIEFRGYLYSGEGGIQLKLGNAFTAEVGGGPEHKLVRLYQDNPHFPLANFERDIAPFIKYDVVLTFRDGTVDWELNGKSIATVPLQKPLTFPLRIGFGSATNKTMYDDVTITGALSPTGARAATPAP